MGRRLLPVVISLAALGFASPGWAKPIPIISAPAPATSLSVVQTVRVGAKETIWFRVHDPLAAFAYNVQVSAGTMNGKLVANTGSRLIHKMQVFDSFVWTPKTKGSFTACVVAMDMGAVSTRNIGYSCKTIVVLPPAPSHQH